MYLLQDTFVVRHPKSINFSLVKYLIPLHNDKQTIM